MCEAPHTSRSGGGRNAGWLEGNNGHWQEQLKAGSVDLVRIFLVIV